LKREEGNGVYFKNKNEKERQKERYAAG